MSFLVEKTLICMVIIFIAFFIIYYSDIIKLKVINEKITIPINFQTKPQKSPHKSHNISKWIVVTTIAHPTPQLKKLVAIPEWKVVVIGDHKTPNNWSYPGCVFLSVEDQMNLGYQITKHLPYNSYTRKMIGYLYAIQNGARFIYDTDDDNCPSNGQLEFILEPSSSGLIYADLSQAVMNPYPHFGQPQLWPRGFPLERIAQAHNHTYHLCTLDTAAVQQGLVNGDPDVDAIYRLINKGSNADININVTFDIRAPPFTLPRGVFAPFNSQNTLFSYPALWALFLPVTVAFRVTDIWRGYWAQRLLWLTGNHLAFHPPNAVQVRNPHSYLKDFNEEIQIYSECGKLVKFLSEWQCESPSFTFFRCVESLTFHMIRREFLKENDLKIVQSWLSDLKRVGYQEPIRRTHSSDTLYSSCNFVNYNSITTDSAYRDLAIFCRDCLVKNSTRNEIFFVNSSKNATFTFSNILLVIVFNVPLLNNVRALEALYVDHFPNILFCAEATLGSYEEISKLINSGKFKWRKNDVSFVNASGMQHGWFGYECAIRAVEMNYKVDGYMFLSDDVLLKPWKMLPFDTSKSRIQNDTYGPHGHQHLTDPISEHHQWSPWWYKSVGFNATNKAFEEVWSISRNLSDPRSPLFQTFIQNRFSNGVNMSLVSFSMCDFYYIAKRDSWMFAQVLKVFLKHKVYLDIAVPTALSGCRTGSPQTEDGFLGTSVWGDDRSDPFKHFTKESVYVHPFKLAQLDCHKKDYLEKYCSEFVAEYYNNW